MNRLQTLYLYIFDENITHFYQNNNCFLTKFFNKFYKNKNGYYIANKIWYETDYKKMSYWSQIPNCNYNFFVIFKY